MCDLIDLNSPDTSKVLKKKLASPLIPPPAGIGKDDLVSVTNGLPNLMADEKRNSLDNNPFDKVFQETTEYVRKKEDPFEMVLEKVTNSKNSKRHSVEFKDDFIPKHTKHAKVLKLNKTLDESMLDIDFNIYSSGFGENSIIEDLNNSALLKKNNNVGNVPQICIQPGSPFNSSVLNYSAMNDSLTETNVNVKETAIRSLVAKRVSMCIQKGIMEAEGMLNNNQQLSLLNSRRCHSQSDKLSPKNFNCRQRSYSIMDTKRKLSKSERSTLSSVHSIEYDDQMNKAFLQEQCSMDNSVFLDLSNVSEITRLNSLSSANNSSLSFLSNGTMNQAFIRSASSSSSQILPTITHSPTNTRKSFQRNSASTISSMNVSETVNNDISDLRQKFETLKVKLSHSSSSDSDDVKKDMPEFSDKCKEFNSNINEDLCQNKISDKENKLKINEKHDTTEEKLIDVEVFIPTNESNSSKSKGSLSDSSSDSVFTKNIMDKSILSEARKLAKTFEEMADDRLNSSEFDLLSSHTQFDFDNLPDSDDEVIEGNLIDLPVSPLKPDVPFNSQKEVKNESPELNEIEKERNKVKDIEMEFTQPKDPENKIVATSLLLELENIIKTEKNPDAEKLLNELEKVLGLKWENNTDLLNTYLANAKSNVQGDTDDTHNKEIENINLQTKLQENKDNVHNVKDKELEENASNIPNIKEGLKRKSSFVIKKGKTDFIKSVSRSFDSFSKVKTSIKKSVPDDLSVNQAAIKNISQSSKGPGRSQSTGVRKRFLSDPNDLINSSLEKKQTHSTILSMKKAISTKEVRDKIITVPEIQKSTLSNMTNAMRNKLKYKSETGVSKKGPMKATVPFGSMQRRGSFVRKVSSLSALETSAKASPEKPSAFHVPTSTPNSSVSSLFKKSKSKPVASSTPDNKEQKTIITKPKSPRSRKLSCNISPVSTLIRSSLEKLDSKESPKENKVNVSPTKRSTTPKALKPPRTPSGIPKYSPLPVMQRRKSLNDLNKSGKCSESSRFPNSSNLQKTLGSAKKIASVLPKSPLRNSNKMDLKCKPLNLISKMQRRGDEYIEAEKENFS